VPCCSVFVHHMLLQGCGYSRGFKFAEIADVAQPMVLAEKQVVQGNVHIHYSRTDTSP
jgi:hypothetical protein